MRTQMTDKQGCEVEAGSKVDVITREVLLQGAALTDEQRGAMLVIADKCPVHRTLHGRVEVRTTAAAA